MPTTPTDLLKMVSAIPGAGAYEATLQFPASRLRVPVVPANLLVGTDALPDVADHVHERGDLPDNTAQLFTIPMPNPACRVVMSFFAVGAASLATKTFDIRLWRQRIRPGLGDDKLPTCERVGKYIGDFRLTIGAAALASGSFDRDGATDTREWVEWAAAISTITSADYWQEGNASGGLMELGFDVKGDHLLRCAIITADTDIQGVGVLYHFV